MTREKAAKFADYIAEYALYAVIHFIPISIALVEIFCGLAIFAFVVKKILDPDFRFIRDYQMLYLALFLFSVFLGLSLFNSGPFLAKSAVALVSKWLQYIILCVVAADTFDKPKKIKIACGVMIFSSTLAALSGLCQYFFGVEFLRGRDLVCVRGDVFAATAAFRHYNSFAAYLICLIPVSMAGFFLRFRYRFLKIGFLMVTSVLIVALLLTFSRGGWLGFLASCVFFAVMMRKYKVVLTAVCGFIISLSCIPFLRQRALFTFSERGDASRFAIWQGAWEMIKDNPFFGKGLGTFMDYFPEFTDGLGIQYAHNCYLQIWAEAGVFALGFFLIFLGIFFYQGIKAVKKYSLCDLSILQIGFLSGLFGFLVHSFFDTQLFSLQIRTLFWVVVGVALAGRRVLREEVV